MKKFLFILIALSFTTTQVMALNCGVSCSVQEEVNKTDSNSHECCHGAKEQQEQSSSCKGELGDTCFHETISESIASKIWTDSFQKMLPSSDYAKIFKVAAFGNNQSHKYSLEYLDREFLKFKSLQNLYILKDQFII